MARQLSLPCSPPCAPLPSAASLLQVGLRGYNVTRQLRLLGYDAVNLTGGWKTYQAVKAANMRARSSTDLPSDLAAHRLAYMRSQRSTLQPTI